MSGQQPQPNNDDTGTIKKSSTTSSSAMNMEPRMYVRSACKTLVDMTNSTLATTQHSMEDARQFVSSRLRPLTRQVQYGIQRVVDFYINDRITYGPQIVAGTATTFGGLTLLRRGKVPGAAVAVLAGTTAYATVYGLQVFPVNDETKKKSL